MSRGWPLAGAALALTLGLAACSTGEGTGTAEPPADDAPITTPDATPDATPVGQRAPVVDLAVQVPQSFEGATPVAPGWTATPREVGDLLVGEAGPDLLLAVDATGEVHWHHPVADLDAWTVSQVDGEPVVVLSRQAEEGFEVSAVDTSGETVWGPVSTRGALVGPGAVIDDGTALDPRDGTPVEVGGTVLGEYDGTVLSTDGASLRAQGAQGAASWERTLREVGPGAAGLTAAAAPRGTALVQGDPEGGSLIDLGTGELLAEGVAEALRDEALGVLVVLGEGGVRGINADGQAWAAAAPDDARLSAVGGALVYLRSGQSVQALNVLTGAVASAYGAPAGDGYAVPALVTGGGAAVVWTDRPVLLAVEARGE